MMVFMSVGKCAYRVRAWPRFWRYRDCGRPTFWSYPYGEESRRPLCQDHVARIGYWVTRGEDE